MVDELAILVHDANPAPEFRNTISCQCCGLLAKKGDLSLIRTKREVT